MTLVGSMYFSCMSAALSSRGIPLETKEDFPDSAGNFLRVAEKESAPDEAGTKISETAQKRDGMFMVCWQWK